MPLCLGLCWLEFCRMRRARPRLQIICVSFLQSQRYMLMFIRLTWRTPRGLVVFVRLRRLDTEPVVFCSCRGNFGEYFFSEGGGTWVAGVRGSSKSCNSGQLTIELQMRNWRSVLSLSGLHLFAVPLLRAVSWTRLVKSVTTLGERSKSQNLWQPLQFCATDGN